MKKLSPDEFTFLTAGWLTAHTLPKVEVYYLQNNPDSMDDSTHFLQDQTSENEKAPFMIADRFNEPATFSKQPTILKFSGRESEPEYVQKVLPAVSDAATMPRFLLSSEQNPISLNIEINTGTLYRQSESEEVFSLSSCLRDLLSPFHLLKHANLTTNEYRAILNENRIPLYDELRGKRAELAREKGVSAFVIFSNRALYDMCVCRPETQEELRELPGVGSVNSKLYGEDFLRIINDHRED